MNLMPFDELNTLEMVIQPYFADGRIRNEHDLDEILDMMEDLFLLAYANGAASANVMTGASSEPVSVEEVQKTVDRKVAGKTWRQRVEEYYSDGGTEADIARIMETEMHRDYNEAALATAKRNGATTKTWMTMMDDKVREQHEYLQSMRVGINEDFYTYDGDHASAPGGFESAENNVNCRCYLMFS